MLHEKFKNPERADKQFPATSAAFVQKRVPAKRIAILAACDRFEANEEFKRQHGPVKIIFHDDKFDKKPVVD